MKKRSYKFSGAVPIFGIIFLLIAAGGVAAYFILKKPKTSVCNGHGKKKDGKCVCDAGWSGDDCSVKTTPPTSCPAGQYLNNSTCTACPPNSTSKAGSTAKSACLCETGYTKDPSSGDCVQCDAGTYKSATGPDACTKCPPNTTSKAGSTAKSDCVCEANYGKNQSGDCVQCPAGTYLKNGKCTKCEPDTYKSATGSGPCTKCPSGKTTHGIRGATKQDDCTDKAIHPTSCPAGQYLDNTGAQPMCAECAVNTYKSKSGAGPCTKCPQNSSTNGTIGSIKCTCDTGYTKDSTTETCVKSCPKDCSGHGICNGTTGTCKCDDGWTGLDCATMDPSSCTCSPACSSGTCGPCKDTSGYCYDATTTTTGKACPTGTKYCCDSSTTNTVVKAKSLQGTSTKWATK